MGRGIFDAEARGDIPAGTAGHIIHQYLGAGIDTTVAAIGNVVALFAAHPDQLALVREDPSLVPAAFNEVLRYWAPVHAWGRRATRDVEIDGAVVPAGAQVAILFGAGNRDPRHYDDPDAFLVERNPVDHLSFGYGPHGCAGQGLARLEAHAVIAALARRVSTPRGRRDAVACRATSPGASTSSPSSRWCRHEDRPGPAPLRGPRPVRGGGPALMHLDDEGELVLDREERRAQRRRSRPRTPPSGSVPSRRSGSRERRCARSSSSATASPA